MILQEVRGTKDLMPEDLEKMRHIQSTCYSVARNYGFLWVDTPIFEFTEVFTKTLGDSSDVITKEMYNFQDKGGEDITLRPELTAPMARLLISKNLNLPTKLFATGPVFRYERPQKCRQRQFHQVNFECFGIKSFHADVEMISLASNIIKSLGFYDDVVLEINSLGDESTISLYKRALVEYLVKYSDFLSDASRNRLYSNPLRILDSKDSEDRKILMDAPSISYYYSDDVRSFFKNILSSLDILNISYSVNEKLVRGLDYYCHTVFEFTSSKLGAQSAVFAGGRYDGLVESMGGKNTPAVGFACGIERIMNLIDFSFDTKRPVAVIPIGLESEIVAISVVDLLRKNSIATTCEYTGSLQSQLKKASKLGASFSIIFGENELLSKTFLVKNMDTGMQESIKCDDLYKYLTSYEI